MIQPGLYGFDVLATFTMRRPKAKSLYLACTEHSVKMHSHASTTLVDHELDTVVRSHPFRFFLSVHSVPVALYTVAGPKGRAS